MDIEQSKLHGPNDFQTDENCSCIVHSTKKNEILVSIVNILSIQPSI